MLDYYSLFSEYLAEQKPNSANTRESYLRDTLHFLEFLSETGVVPEQAGEEDIQGYVDHLHELGRSPTTITRNLASVRCFYKFLIFRGLLDKNPAKGIKLERPRRSCPRCSPGRRSTCFWPAPTSPTPRAAGTGHAGAAVRTGIRASELINLDIGDINLRSGVLYCRGNKGVRSIPVYPAAVVAVSDYIYRMRGLIAGPERRRRPVRQPQRRPADPPGLLEDRQGLRRFRRHHQGDHTPHPAAFLRPAPAGGRCLGEGHPDHDGPRGHLLYPGVRAAVGQPCKAGLPGLPPQSQAGLTGRGEWFLWLFSAFLASTTSLAPGGPRASRLNRLFSASSRSSGGSFPNLWR